MEKRKKVNATKKYYWLKLKENFFEEDTISWLEEQENGVYYSNFYLKLCLKSLKRNGILIRNVGDMLIPYDIKKLSEITHVKLDTAIVAMELFKKIGLVKILDTGEIYLTQLENMVGSETSKAALMRKKRMKDKLLKSGSMDGNNVTKVLPESYTEKEKEIDTDIEQDKEIDIKQDRNMYTEEDRNAYDEKGIKHDKKIYKEKDNSTDGDHMDSSIYLNFNSNALSRIPYPHMANASAYAPLKSILD